MRCVITGGRGFVGTHLDAQLRAAGHQVTLLDRAEFDVADRHSVDKSFASAAPELIFHLAALTHVGRSWEDPAVVHRVNVGGTHAVLLAAEQVGAHAVVVVGSSEEYGSVDPGDTPIVETHRLMPISPYAKSKVEATTLAVEFAASSATRVVIARPFNHTGPGQATNFLIPALAERIRNAVSEGSHSIMVGNLDPIRDIGDVRDVVRAYIGLAESGENGEIYNVCTGVGVSVLEIANMLVSLSGADLSLEQDSDLVRKVDTPILIGDNSKIKARTGWCPTIDLRTTLQDVLTSG